MLEDGGVEKRRCHPDRIERRNFRKLNGWLRNGNKRGSIALLIFAGSDERDRAFVLAQGCILVNAFVQLWRNCEREREKERSDSSRCYQAAPARRLAAANTDAHEGEFASSRKLRKRDLPSDRDC